MEQIWGDERENMMDKKKKLTSDDGEGWMTNKNEGREEKMCWHISVLSDDNKGDDGNAVV